MKRLPLIYSCILLWSCLSAESAGADTERTSARGQALAAGVYLCRALQPDGRFVYSWNPVTGTVADTYNWLRHAGTIVSLCQLYEYTKVEQFRDAANQAMPALLRQLRNVRILDRKFQVIVSDPRTVGARNRNMVTIKTGGCALAAVALLQLDAINGNAKHRTQVLQLCEYLQFTQLSSGDLRSKYLIAAQKFSDFRSNYYAGEALVALALANQRYPDRGRHRTMLRLLAFLLTRWEAATEMGGNRIPLFDHWGMIGAAYAVPQLTETDYADWPGKKDWSSETLLRLILNYCANEMGRQLRKDGTCPAGSFAARPGATTPTAIRLEGLSAAGELMTHKEIGLWKKLPEKWHMTLEQGRSFLAACQYHSDNPPPQNKPLNPLGGFRRGYDYKTTPKDAEIRIDYCQHAISALLGWQYKKPKDK